MPIKQNLKDENLDNLNFVLYILLVPIDCHMRFEYVITYYIRVKLLK